MPRASGVPKVSSIPPRVEALIAMVAIAFHLEPKAVLVRTRSKTVVNARQVLMWLMYNTWPHPSLSEIGVALGGRDHATVALAKKRISREIETGTPLGLVAKQLLARLKTPRHVAGKVVALELVG